MGTFGTSENGEPLEFYAGQFRNSSGIKATIVEGTNTDDTFTAPEVYTVAPTAENYEVNGDRVFPDRFHVNLGQGYDTVDYSQMQGGELGLYAFIGKNSLIVNRTIDPNWEAHPDANPDLFDATVWNQAIDYVKGAEAIVGTNASDNFEVSACPIHLESIDGGAELNSISIPGTNGDRLDIVNQVPPVDWRFDSETSGQIVGNGIFVKFTDIENTGIRPGDSVNGEVQPGVPPADLEDKPYECNTLHLSQMFGEAERELANLDVRDDLQQQILDTLRETSIAARVETMANSGVESVELPENMEQANSVIEFVTIAQVAEEHVNAFEVSIENEMTEAASVALPLAESEDYYDIM